MGRFWPAAHHRLGHALRRAHRDQRGTSLPELLVGVIIGAIVIGAGSSVIFTTNKVQQAAGDETRLAGQLAGLSLWFDRDAAKATADATAKFLLTDHVSEDCASRAMDLGFTEGGSTVRYQQVAVAGSPGYDALQRISGNGTITLARYLNSCAWLPEGKILRLSVCFRASVAATSAYECVSRRGAPRTW